MNLKHLVIAIPLVAGSAAAQAEVYDARTMGRGGVGLTMGEYNQSMINPALINQFDENDEFSFALNAGAFASDEDGMLDDIDVIEEDLDDLEVCGQTDPNPAANCSAAALKQSLASLDEKLVQIGAGAAVMIGVPNRKLPMAVVARRYADVGVQLDYVGTDSAVLDDIADGPSAGDPLANQDDLMSSISASAISVTELGLLFGRTLEQDYQLGATFKYQTIELIQYRATVSDFDTSDIVDTDNFHKKHTGINIDLGVRKVFGIDKQFVYAVTLENLIPQNYKGPGGSTFSMNPVPVAAVGYQLKSLKAEASLDLSDRAGFGVLDGRQYARIGAELSAGRHAHFRAGYQMDLNNTVSNLLSVGFGLTPWDRANLDLAVQTGEGETFGAALQLGFKI